MSGSVRRLQRQGHPVAGEQLEGVQAYYRNAKGDAFTVEVDARSADMAQLYRSLIVLGQDVGADAWDLADVLGYLDTVAAKSHLRKRRLPIREAILALQHVYWLEFHGHLATNEHNGMVFAFSRPSPTEPGERVGFFRQTLDPTRGQETAFARAVKTAGEGEIVKVLEDEGGAA